jgi:hypothetical protein
LVNNGTRNACGIQLDISSHLVQDSKPLWEIYPNPAHTEIQFKGISEFSQANCKIMDATGQLVLDQPIQSNNSVSVVHLKSGIYFVVLEIENSQIFRGKLVIL